MSDTDANEYLRYRELMKNLLLSVGVWPVENPNMFYRALPYLQTGVSLITAYMIFGFVQAHSDNINLIIRGLSIMTSFLTIALKLACLIIYRKEMDELHILLDEYLKNLISQVNITRIILKNVRIFRYLTVIFVILVIYPCVCWVFIPLYHNIQQYVNHVQPVKFALIYPSVYPWTVPPSGYIFQLHFFFESLAATALCLITSSVDSLFTFYVFQIIGQLREISYSISLVNKKNNDGTIIRKCVMQYQNIMKCRDIIEKIYGPLILWTMGTNAVILCTLMFQITYTKSLSKARIGLLATYISLKVIQTFMYSWSGSQLTEESENYGTAVYSAKWYGNKKFMTSAIIMIMQRPLVLTACNFSVVSLNIFVMILNTTMSYFFLLQAIEADT